MNIYQELKTITKPSIKWQLHFIGGEIKPNIKDLQVRYAVFLVLSILASFTKAEEFGRWAETPDCISCINYPEAVIKSAKGWATKNIDYTKGRINFTYNVFSSGSDYKVIINIFRLTNESSYVYSSTLTLLINHTGNINNVIHSKEP